MTANPGDTPFIPEADQQRILDYEDFAAKVASKRRTREQKKWWESVGLVSSLTALLTVALTSVGSYCVQSNLRRSEMRSHADRAALEGEIDALNRSHLLAINALHFTDERHHIAQKHYKLQPEQMRRLIDSVNASDAEWRRGRQGKRLDLGLRFPDSPQILTAWDTLAARLDRYSKCSMTETQCDAIRKESESSLVGFRRAAVDYVVRHSRKLDGGPLSKDTIRSASPSSP